MKMKITTALLFIALPCVTLSCVTLSCAAQTYASQDAAMYQAVTDAINDASDRAEKSTWTPEMLAAYTKNLEGIRIRQEIEAAKLTRKQPVMISERCGIIDGKIVCN